MAEAFQTTFSNAHLKEMFHTPIQILLEFIPNDLIDNKSAFDQ